MSDEKRTVRASIPYPNGTGRVQVDRGEINAFGIEALHGLGFLTDDEAHCAIEARKAYKWRGDVAWAKRVYRDAADEIGCEVIP